MSSLFKRYLDQQIDKAIYVWGAQGDVLSALHDPEKWIKNQESDPTNRKRVIDLYRARKAGLREQASRNGVHSRGVNMSKLLWYLNYHNSNLKEVKWRIINRNILAQR